MSNIHKNRESKIKLSALDIGDLALRFKGTL